jgi:hypothetical protein
MRWFLAVALILALGNATQATACVLCNATDPLSREIAKYPLVIFGPIVDAKLNPDNTGTCTVRIDKVFRDATRALQGRKTLVINRYTPPNPAVHYLLFFQFVGDGRLDVLRPMDFDSPRLIKYMEDAPPVKEDEASRLTRLRYYFNFLMDPEPKIAWDAFCEWSKATDKEVTLVAPSLDANRLRTWLRSPKTPTHCLSLFGYLLGACGTPEDADLLKRMILNPDARMGNALDGLMAGYIHIRPEEGWKLAQELLADSKRPFTQRLALKRMLQFYYNAKPTELRSQILACAKAMLGQSYTLDIIIEQMRRWQMWDLTDAVLQKYGTPEADSRIVQNQIIRYAITCPLPQAKTFLKTVDQQRVKELQTDLEFEAPANETTGK